MSLMRKALYLGLGALSFTKEKAEKAINEMSEKGEMTRDEAKQFVDDIMQKGEEQKAQIKEMITDEINDFRKNIGVVSRADYEALEARVKELENQLAAK